MSFTGWWGTPHRMRTVDMVTQVLNEIMGNVPREILMRLTAGPIRNRVKNADMGQDHANPNPDRTPTRFIPENKPKTINRDRAALLPIYSNKPNLHSCAARMTC